MSTGTQEMEESNHLAAAALARWREAVQPENSRRTVRRISYALNPEVERKIAEAVETRIKAITNSIMEIERNNVSAVFPNPQAIRNDHPPCLVEEEKENPDSHPPHDVIKIDDNGVLKVDKRKTERLNTFLKFCWNRLFGSHYTVENRLTIWAAFYGAQWAQLSVLGNPLDKLSQSTSREESLLGVGRACFVTVWTAIFFLNFIYMAMLILPWPSPYRIPAYLMLGLSLLYYILAIIVAMSGYSVSWGSAQMSGLLFVFGGATGLMLLLGFIIMVVLYATWRSSESAPN